MSQAIQSISLARLQYDSRCVQLIRVCMQHLCIVTVTARQSSSCDSWFPVLLVHYQHVNFSSDEADLHGVWLGKQSDNMRQ